MLHWAVKHIQTSVEEDRIPFKIIQFMGWSIIQVAAYDQIYNSDGYNLQTDLLERMKNNFRSHEHN